MRLLRWIWRKLEREERERVVVGWDGASRPMLRYRDELELPDYRRRRVVEPLDEDEPEC